MDDQIGEQVGDPSGDRFAELNAKMERMEELVTALERCSDAAIRDQARELVGTLMDFHGAGLSRLMELLSAKSRSSEDLIGEMGKDRIVGSLLLLYGLHPAETGTRVNDALDDVRPALKAHRGDVELVTIAGSTVHLRLIGTCNGCPSSTTTFRNLIERAIFERAPEINAIQVEGLAL